MQVISNLANLRIKVSYNISIILKIQQIILNFEILCNIKNYKNRLGCNLLGFPQTSCVKTFAAKQHRETFYVGRLGNYEMSWNLNFVSAL